MFYDTFTFKIAYIYTSPRFRQAEVHLSKNREAPIMYFSLETTPPPCYLKTPLPC